MLLGMKHLESGPASSHRSAPRPVPSGSLLDQMKVDRLTPDQCEQVLVEAERQIAQLRWIQALALRSAVRQQVPLRDGCRTTAEWIRGRVDTTPETARSLEAVARLNSSELDSALESGDVGFDRVAEAARAGDGDIAPHLDLGAMRRRAGRRHWLSREQEIRDHGARSLTYQRSMFGTFGRLWAEGPAEATDAMFDAIDAAADALPAPPLPEPRAARRFDGFRAMCEGGAGGVTTRRATVIVDAKDAASNNGEAAVWVTSGARVGPGTLERILCESVVDVIARTEDGKPLSIGTPRRAVPGRVRRWVEARDGGGCTADGCQSTTRLQPHHIRHRSANGGHDPDNLTTLCWYHHHVVVHGRGFRIDPTSPQQRRRFLPPIDRSPGSSDPP